MDYPQAERLDAIQRELTRQSALLERLLALHQAPAAAPSAPAPAPKPSLLRRVARRLRGATP